MTDILTLTLQDKLYRTKYEPDEAHPHIFVKNDYCLRCDGKPCLFFCPAEVYKPDPNNKQQILVNHENCLECGTCRYGCPFEAIDWRYPDGAMGVKYRFG
jgi:ferredoxin like protein